MLKIGMLTSGGDCQGLNAALRGVAKTLYNELGDKVTIYGIRDGYRGLIEGDYHEMLPEDFSDILTVGGTILGDIAPAVQGNAQDHRGQRGDQAG